MKLALRELRSDPRQHLPSIIVVTLASFFGATLIQAMAVLRAWLNTQGLVAGSATATLMVGLVGAIFFGIALFVSSLVISNTFGIIVAGRTPRIALLRLIGASARTLRRSVGVEGLIIGLVGGVVGLVLSCPLAWAGAKFLSGPKYSSRPLDFALLRADLLVPLLLMVLLTWACAWSGAARVLTVSPIEATGAAREPNLTEARSSTAKKVLSIIGVIGGALLLLGGLGLGLVSPFGLPIAFLGGVGSFVGLSLGSAWVLPPVQRLISRIFAGSAAGRQAARNCARFPIRTSRSTMGLVIGVTLIAMFGTASYTFQSVMIGQVAQSDQMAGMEEAIRQLTNQIMSFFAILLAFSVLIAMIGVINNISLSVTQRTREIGLLRAVGMSRRGVRSMVLSEAGQITLTGSLFGLLLGVFYGWVGAMSTLGSLPGVGMQPPTVPWPILGGSLVLALLVVVGSSTMPAGRAAAVAPTEALRAA